MGSYLWKLEKEIGLSFGWEDWVYRKYYINEASTKLKRFRTVWQYYSEDIQILLSVFYLAATILSEIVLNSSYAMFIASFLLQAGLHGGGVLPIKPVGVREGPSQQPAGGNQVQGEHNHLYRPELAVVHNPARPP